MEVYVVVVVAALARVASGSSGFVNFDELDYNCPNFTFRPADLQYDCGIDSAHSCPLVLNTHADMVGVCGMKYYLANLELKRMIWGVVVHRNPTILPRKFGVLSNGWRTLCPYTCQGLAADDGSMCVDSPADCSEGAEGVEPPQMMIDRDGQVRILAGSRDVLLQAAYLSYDGSDVHLRIPDELKPNPVSLLGVRRIRQGDYRDNCSPAERFTYVEAVTTSCGESAENPCVVVYSALERSGMSCGSCVRLRLHAHGLSDTAEEICNPTYEGGACLPYSRDLYVQIAAFDALEFKSDVTAWAPQSVWSQLCPRLCLSEGGTSSHVCVRSTQECLHGTVRDSVVQGGGDWAPYVLLGSMEALPHHVEVHACNNSATTTTSSTSTTTRVSSASAAPLPCGFWLVTMLIVFVTSSTTL